MEKADDLGQQSIREIYDLWQIDQVRSNWIEDEDGFGFDCTPGTFTV